ncbi:MAG: sulfurtransferase TusA family protein [Candidatus Bathyarchaeia archaeon]
MSLTFSFKKITEGRYSLDVRGLVCPYPQVIATQTLEEKIKPGEILEIILDNPPSVRDIPQALREKGYKTIEVSNIDERTWKIMVQAKTA